MQIQEFFYRTEPVMVGEQIAGMHHVLAQSRLLLPNGDPEGAIKPRLCITLNLRALSSDNPVP